MSPGIIYRLSISNRKGQQKHNVPRVKLDVKKGIIGDAHGETDRPVSLLPYESFSKLEHPDLSINPGDFAENITTSGLNFETIWLGTILKLGKAARLEVIQIGKECHESCVIRETAGDCIMPTEGLFAKVISPGEVAVNDPIKIESDKQ
jgi:MOSC domain-containing protein YiiM